MPTRATRQCTAAGCGNPSTGGRCPAHRPNDTRPSAAARGYDRKWARNRGRFLTANPDCTCAGCPACYPTDGPCTRPANEADHQPERAVLIARGEPHPDAWRWLHPRCKPCHSSRTARTSSGWGGPPSH